MTYVIAIVFAVIGIFTGACAGVLLYVHDFFGAAVCALLAAIFVALFMFIWKTNERLT